MPWIVVSENERIRMAESATWFNNGHYVYCNISHVQASRLRNIQRFEESRRIRRLALFGGDLSRSCPTLSHVYISDIIGVLAFECFPIVKSLDTFMHTATQVVFQLP